MPPVVPCPCSYGKPPHPDVEQDPTKPEFQRKLLPCAGEEGKKCTHKPCAGLYHLRQERERLEQEKKKKKEDECRKSMVPMTDPCGRPLGPSRMDQQSRPSWPTEQPTVPTDPNNVYFTLFTQDPRQTLKVNVGYPPKKTEQQAKPFKDRSECTGNIDLITKELKQLEEELDPFLKHYGLKEDPTNKNRKLICTCKCKRY